MLYLILTLSSVQYADMVVNTLEMIGQGVALLLGVDEADDLVVRCQGLQLLNQAALLLVLRNEHHTLFNALVLAGVLVTYSSDSTKHQQGIPRDKVVLTYPNADWMAQVSLRDLLHLWRHGRGKHCRDSENFLPCLSRLQLKLQLVYIFVFVSETRLM